jgi:hypothetical protein
MRSSCLLTRLVLHCEVTSTHGLIQYLLLTHHAHRALGPYMLVSLKKEYECFSMLSRRAGIDVPGTYLAPRLKTITFGFVSALQEFVFADLESRWRVDDLKSTIRLSTQRDSIGVLTLARLRRMQGEDLDVAVFSDLLRSEQIL